MLLTCDFLFTIIIIARCKKMTKDHGGDIHFLLLVHNNRNSFSIIPDLDFVVLTKIKKNKINSRFKKFLKVTAVS